MTGIFVAWSHRRDSAGWVEDGAGCHVWIGSLNRKGYGCVRVGGRSRHAHRVRYEREVGAIPRGMQLDHLCKNPSCCNPAHLEIVTPRENTLRGNAPAAKNRRRMRCAKGHVYDVVRPCGRRDCSICRAEYHRHRRMR